MDNYLDSVNKHQVYISRLATGILKDEVYPSINEAYKAVRLVLSQYGDINSINDVNKVNAAINKAISENLTVGFTAATASMSTIAVNEAAYTAGLLSSTLATNEAVRLAEALSSSKVSRLSVPSESKINKYVRESIMSLSSGKSVTATTWEKYVKGFIGNGKLDSTGNMARAYNNIITSAFNDSLTSGKMETLGQLTKRFRAANENILRRDAENLVRTGVSHYAGRANQLMAMDNSDIIEREVPIVTFDDRISKTCISIDARYREGWPLGKSPIGYNPWHYGCRSIVGYLLFGQKEFDGTKASKGAEGGKQIAATTPFAKFLRDQPKSFIYETLGKRRAELFLAGKLPLASLTDRYLNPLPLSVLDS